MSDPEQVKILRSGKAAWKKWRKQSKERPDLSGAKLNHLAHMACFVIPDLSGAKSVPQELSFIVPFLPSVPVVPIVAAKNEGIYSKFEHFLRYPWVHEPVTYRDVGHLLSIADERVIDVGFRAAMRARGTPDVELPALPELPRQEL